jgi:hypothetical protein
MNIKSRKKIETSDYTRTQQLVNERKIPLSPKEQIGYIDREETRDMTTNREAVSVLTPLFRATEDARPVILLGAGASFNRAWRSTRRNPAP